VGRVKELENNHESNTGWGFGNVCLMDFVAAACVYLGGWR
jgi:hypothetical protein